MNENTVDIFRLNFFDAVYFMQAAYKYTIYLVQNLLTTKPVIQLF